MINSAHRLFSFLLLSSLIASCSPATAVPTQIEFPTVATATQPTETPIAITTTTATITGTPAAQTGFLSADGSRPLTFPADFGAHPDFHTEWWYYTGNLESTTGRHFGFELTIFRVGLLPPTAAIPKDSKWSSREIYFAHFAISDIGGNHFYAFQRYSRPGPGLAGADGNPYHVWLEDWNITEQSQGVYQLQAEQEKVVLNLTLTDEMGVILQGDKGYSRKGKDPTNASYYYSQPRLRVEGSVKINSAIYQVNGLAWNDHEFSTGVLDENQIGWDWFSLQFDDGRALMLFQLRERGGGISDSASGTFISSDKTSQSLHKSDFEITVLDEWRSPHTQGIYPSSWQVRIHQPNCQLEAKPWMSDQEVNFPPITYWEGAVHFTGTCDGASVNGNGYIELTGYAGSLPMP